MRRVQLMLSEQLDAALSAEARRGGMSRSAAARRLLERALGERDPETDGARLLKLAGIVDSKGASDARDVDEVVYGVSKPAGLRRQRPAHRSR